MERTFAAKQRDYEELLLLSGDANHAREVAQSELEHVRGGYEEERRRRELELRERHQMVQLRKQTIERIQKREKMRHEIVAQEAGELSTHKAASDTVTTREVWTSEKGALSRPSWGLAAALGERPRRA